MKKIKILFAGLVLISVLVLIYPFVFKAPDYEVDWLLWLDKNASWQNEEPETPISAAEKIKPSCGWANLFKNHSRNASEVFKNSNLSLCVSMPSTVEEHFWDEISGEKKGAETSGDYRGVSWWGKEIFIPKDAKNKIVKKYYNCRGCGNFMPVRV
ncbi:MAG: hypothetical protein IKS15_05390 [Opitutales bacterium]|nr:hypothetical protein [Opitutales bacterium]